MKLRVPFAARRAGWNLADQIVSSGTNAVLSFLVARSVDDETFGGFAVAFTVFSLGIGFSRALSSSPLGIRFTDVAEHEFRAASAAGVGSAVVIGFAGGAVSALAGLLVGGPAGQALLALGAVLPALLVQDAWRYVFFAAARPAAAVVNDGLWAVVQLLLVWLLIEVHQTSVWALVLAWGGSALAAAVLGVWQARLRPRPRETRRWLRAHRDLTGFIAAEFATIQGAGQGAFLLIAAVGSLEALGALRGAQIVLAPTTILAGAALSFAIPEFSRRRSRLDLRGWLLGAAAVSGVVAVLGFLWGLLFLVVPEEVGRALLGDTWTGTSEILWPTVIGQLGGALSLGAMVMLIAMGRTSVTFRINAVLAPLIFVGGVGGVLLAGAPGAAWGLGLANWVVLPAGWILLHREATALVAGRVEEVTPN